MFTAEPWRHPPRSDRPAAWEVSAAGAKQRRLYFIFWTLARARIVAVAAYLLRWPPASGASVG